MSTAIFGGTFDPVHNGHLEAARAAADGFGIDKVLFIPAGNPPHRRRLPEADYEDRLRMVELACAEDQSLRRVAARRAEQGNAGRHYSVRYDSAVFVGKSDLTSACISSWGRTRSRNFRYGIAAKMSPGKWNSWSSAAPGQTFQPRNPTSRP